MASAVDGIAAQQKPTVGRGEPKLVGIWVTEEWRHILSATQLRGDSYSFEMLPYGHVRVTDKRSRKTRSYPLSSVACEWSDPTSDDASALLHP